MSGSAHHLNLWLSDLEAPLLDLSSGGAAQLLLDRLKTQNFALDRLRQELDCEDRLSFEEFAATEGV